MAIMNKMRERMTVIFAGLAGAFLLMIIFEWGAQGDFFKTGPRGDEIGEVNGERISNKEYQDLYGKIRQSELAKAKKQTLGEAEEAALNEKAWDEAITQKLIDQKLKEYGVTVTDQEVRERLFYNPPEDIKRGFIDSVGRFHQPEYWAELRNPKNDSIVIGLTQGIREQMKREKLQGMLFSTIRLTNGEMWDRFEAQSSKATVQVVKIAPPPTAFRDFIAKVNDEDIKKYYDDHKWQFKREEGRKLKFVVFRELPTSRDSLTVVERAQTLVKRWKELPSNTSDSILGELAHDYSDAPFQKAQPLSPAMLAGFSNPDSLFNAKVGDVIVSASNGQIKVIRVLGEVDSGGEFTHLQNILIGFGRPENRDSAKGLAQNVLNSINAGGTFEDAARKYSADPSARNGGDMKWVGPKMYVPQVEAASASAPLNTLVGPIESSIGYHLIKVLGRAKRKLIVQVIPMEIRPSSQTIKMSTQQANIFHEQALKKGFDVAAKDMGLKVIADGPAVQKKSQQTMFNNPQWVNYLFELNAGDITTAVRMANSKLTVVAQVTEAYPKGTRPLDEDLKKMIKNQVARQKMVESVAPKAKELRAMIGAGDGLEKLASADSNLRPFNVTMSPGEATAQLGSEYAVNTVAFYKMKVGEISQPVKGEGAYFIVKLLDLKLADKTAYDQQKPQLYQQLSQEKMQRFFQQWLSDLKDQAKVKDYRLARN